MILQELCRLYDRLLRDPARSDEMPRPGWSKEKVSWALVLGPSGEMLQIVPIGPRDGDKVSPENMLVPEHDGRSGKSPKAYFLCDKASFLLGLDDKGGEASRERSRRLHHEILDGCNDDGARAVLSFFDRESPKTEIDDVLAEQLQKGGMIVLCLNGVHNRIHDRPAVHAAWASYIGRPSDDEVIGTCSVTGERGPLARLFPQVTGIPGAQSSGASLVSFNFGASESYGKRQSYNASISVDAAFRAGSALKYLLTNRERYEAMGSTIVTFWTDRFAPLEESFIAATMLFKPPAEDKHTLDVIEGAFDAMRKGAPLEGLDTDVRYFVLGVSPNAARLSVRFFETGTLGQLAKNYGDYLRDVEMVGTRGSSLWGFLVQTAPEGKADKIPSTLVSRCFSAMIRGTDFPLAFEQLVLSRTRADHANNKPWDMGKRAAILKGCLVRRARIRGMSPKSEEQIDMALNRENKDAGYLLGRLFAVMERAQQAALGDTNATIRDKYIGAASTTPLRVFQTLLRGCQPHLGKLRKDASKGWLSRRLEGELDEIMKLLPDDDPFPSVLPMDEQAMFFVGYYQQRSDLWTKRQPEVGASEPDEETNDSKED